MGEDTVNEQNRESVDRIVEQFAPYGAREHPEGHRTGRRMVVLSENGKKCPAAGIIEVYARTSNLAVRYVGPEDEIRREVYWTRLFGLEFRIEEYANERIMEPMPPTSKPYQ